MQNYDKTLLQLILPRFGRIPHMNEEFNSRPPLYYRVAISTLAPVYRYMIKRRSQDNANYEQEVADRFGSRYEGNLTTELLNASDTQNEKLIDRHQNDTTQNDKVTDTLTDDVANPKKPIIIDDFDPIVDLGVSMAQQHGIIWCHAVSLGETNTIAPVIDMLMEQGYRIWLTNTTQTGYARGASLYQQQIAEGKLFHSYVPVDSPKVIRKFIGYIKPCAALFVETELWANTLHELALKDIPAILVNARLSAKSYASYQKIGKTTQTMMNNLSLIIAQDDVSAVRFRRLGAQTNRIRVAGSLKWTVNANQLLLNETEGKQSKLLKWKKRLQTQVAVGNRPIWVAASTHEGEERVALSGHQQLLAQAQTANALLILVPRHPERFDEVARQIEESGLSYLRRSDNVLPDKNCHVYLADSMGELMRWYKMADVAFVGGSMVNIGGHNPVEAYLHATPVIMGQFTQSCQSVVDDLVSHKAMVQLDCRYEHEKGKPLAETAHQQATTQLYEQLNHWLTHKEHAQQAGILGQNLAKQNQNILPAQVEMINHVINAKRLQALQYLS